jgi:hypothetical protein
MPVDDRQPDGQTNVMLTVDTFTFHTIPHGRAPHRYPAGARCDVMAPCMPFVALLLLASAQAATQRSSGCTAKAVWPDGRDEDRCAERLLACAAEALHVALTGLAEEVSRGAPSAC